MIRWLRWLVAVLALGLVLAPSAAAAAPCTRTHPLPAGEIAPCDGDLAPVAWLRELLHDRAARRRLEREAERAAERARIELAAARDDLEVERTARLAAERDRTPPPRLPAKITWWKRPEVAFLGGIIVAGGLCALGFGLAQ